MARWLLVDLRTTRAIVPRYIGSIVRFGSGLIVSGERFESSEHTETGNRIERQERPRDTRKNKVGFMLIR